MSPIIELQRRMVEAGRIRAGDFGDGHPRKLKHWRLTSKDNERLLRAQELWGGTYRSWRDAEWELYTETAELPIMLLPGHVPTTWYELWTKGGCQRRCDGVHETISDSACLCGDERECKPHTRLSVLLPDLPGIGSWLLSSTGWNAAAELAGAADLLQRASAQGVLIPARLRLEQRQDVKAGQTRKYAVPVIDIDITFRSLLGGQGAAEIPSGRTALPSGFTPVPPTDGNGVSLAQGLEQAGSDSPRPSRQAPLPATDVEFETTAPVPVDEEPVAPSPAAGSSLKPTKRQGEKLNVLVGKLRDGGHITTEQLYSALAKSRNVDVTVMIDVLPGAYDEQSVLHWAPLRESLTRSEASDLIDRLSRLEEHVGAPA